MRSTCASVSADYASRVPDTIDGIPLHPLVVHGAVVLVPLAALGVIAIALVPKWRQRFGILVMGGAVVAAVTVFVARQTGQHLRESFGESELIDQHADLGDKALLGAVPLVIAAVALWWLGRLQRQDQPVPSWVWWAVPAISVVVAVAALVQIVLIGHSGAKAVWG